MAEAPGTSFIPKNANRVRKPRTSKRIYIFSYISYVFFFGTLLAVLGVYIFSVQTTRAVEEVKQELARERETFNQGDIAAVRDLEKRILAAEKLVGENAAPSTLFSSLESIVVDPVRFASIAYERLPSNEFTLTFAVAADAFDPILFERELMKAIPVLANAEVSGYSYGEADEQEESGGSSLAVRERVVVTFESRASTGMIPYDPSEASNDMNDDAPSLDGASATGTDTGEGSIENEPAGGEDDGEGGSTFEPNE